MFAVNLYLFSFLLFCFFFTSAYCQPFNPKQVQEQEAAINQFLEVKYSRIDSLKKRLERANETIKVDCLNELYEATLVLDNDSAWNYLSNAMKLANKIQYHKGVAGTLFSMSRFFTEQRNLPVAETYLRKSIAMCKKYGLLSNYYAGLQSLGYNLFLQLRFNEANAFYDTVYKYITKNGNSAEVAYINRLKGKLLETQGRYEEAFGYFETDLKLSKNIRDTKGSRQSYYTYANFYFGKMFMEMGDKKTAIKYFNKSAEQGKANLMPDWYDERMATNFFILENYDSALYYFRLRDHCMGLIIKDRSFYDIVRIETVANMAMVLLAKKKFNEAINLYNKCLPFCSDFPLLAITVHEGLAKAYEGLDNYEKALQYSARLFELSETSGYRQYLREAADIRSRIFHQLHQNDSAYKYLRILTSIKDTLAADKQLRSIALMEMKTREQQHASEITMFEQERKINNKQKQVLLLSLAGFVLISFLLFCFMILKRKSLQRELLLQKLEKENVSLEFNKQIADLEMQALRAQMNPHFIFNSLNSINNFILKNNKQEASRYLIKFSRLVRMILNNSQSSLISLNDELDALKLYIELELLRFNNRFEYSITVPRGEDFSFYKVPPLIIQPYVENAIWHGLMHKEENGRLEIDILKEDSFLLFKISDDGVGRKRAEESSQRSGNTYKSSGSRITSQRISVLKNSDASAVPVQIIDRILSDGSPGGTTVIIKLPIIYD